MEKNKLKTAAAVACAAALIVLIFLVANRNSELETKTLNPDTTSTTKGTTSVSSTTKPAAKETTTLGTRAQQTTTTEEPEKATTTTPETTLPIPSLTTQTSPEDTIQTEETIQKLVQFVETERGLKFIESPIVHFLPDAEFQEKLKSTEENPETQKRELAETADVLKSLELLDKNTELEPLLDTLLDSSVLGFYDPQTKELYVRGTELTVYVKATIIHELVHALDDQDYNLSRPDLDAADDERSFAFSALVEGNARYIEGLYKEAMTQEELSDYSRQERDFASNIDYTQFPEILLNLLSAPYALGEPFVEEIIETEGYEKINTAFTEPPTTSEEIIIPARYLRGEEYPDVTTPGSDGEIFDQGVLGQLLLLLTLVDTVDADEAQEAAIGWGNDRYVSWRTDTNICTRANVVTDSEPDQEELFDALSDWSNTHENAVVSQAEKTVTFTACVSK